MWITGFTDYMASDGLICSYFDIYDNDLEYDYLIGNPAELRTGLIERRAEKGAKKHSEKAASGLT